MERCMKEVLVRTKPKDSFTLAVSDSSANIQTTFNPPLYLEAYRNHELAMVNVETYYSFANIRVITIRSNGVLMVTRLGQFSTYLQDVYAEIVTLQFFQMSTRCNAY